jgi:hypothetical protein
MFLTQETGANEQEDLRELTVRNLSHPSSLSLQALITFLLNSVKKYKPLCNSYFLVNRDKLWTYFKNCPPHEFFCLLINILLFS